MKLRSIAIQFINYKVGNGVKMSAWHDNWHALATLKQIFEGIIIYNAGSTDNDTMSMYVNLNEWNLQYPVFTDYIELVNHFPPYALNIDMQDKVEWTLTTSKEYTCKSAWNAIRCVAPIVIWKDLVWGNDCVPRFSFILWIVC